MNKLILIITIILIGFVSKSQTQDNETVTRKSATARAPQEKKFAAAEAISDNINDIYLGHSDDYSRMFTSTQIPLDFPTYSNILTIEEYKQRVVSYLKLHPELLTEKVRNKYSK